MCETIFFPKITTMLSSPSSLRSLTTKFPFLFGQTKTQLSALKPTKLPTCFRRPITFQKIPTRSPLSLSASPSPSSPSSTDLQPIEELPPKLQEIVKLFQSVQEPKSKYEQLLFYGKNLKPLDSRFKTDENKVSGCVSQVWVRAYSDKDRSVVFEADSDSVLTKGLAALLVQGLSGRPVEEIIRVSPDFVVLLGLKQSLTPSRNNGFLNMLRLMQKKALQLQIESEMSNGFSENLNSVEEEEKSSFDRSENVRSSSKGDVIADHMDTEVSYIETQKTLGSSLNTNSEFHDGKNGSNAGKLGSRGVRIKEKLLKELSPTELKVEDISHEHAGHAGVRGADGETHFNVKVVSREFEGKSLVKRHRLVYTLLQDELQAGLHAVSIVAKTPSEV